MAVKIKTQYGDIDITNNVIATVVGGAATDIYGIVGMASKNQIRDNLNEILNRENYKEKSHIFFAGSPHIHWGHLVFLSYI